MAQEPHAAMENHIDLALVKKFYSNLYDPEDRSPRQCKVRGKTIKFDARHTEHIFGDPRGA